MSLIDNQRQFHSKILLFGEYSIILDSTALSIPFPLFKGVLRFASSHERSQSYSSHQELLSFADFLDDLLSKENDFPFDLSSFRFDLSQGLFFDSSIPEGHGIGSSGALVANLFYRYGRIKERLETKSWDKDYLLQLRQWLGKMEGHFHGKSSGLDPLISYVNRPLLILSENDMSVVDLPLSFQFEHDKKHSPAQDISIFLLNTKRARSTGPLVQLFLEMRKEQKFVDFCERDFLPINELLIEQFLSGQLDSMYSSFIQLSSFQYSYFRPMIPYLIQKTWQKGLENEDYALKLCGAGGGGFLLGMTKNFEKTQQLLHPFEIRRIF
jgi:mevalonate kinase